jgi:hypothetical protein
MGLEHSPNLGKVRMVRAVGIEPTLLAELDFESGETTLYH